jgi:superfamily II DNA/RNA helicase
LQTDIRTQAVFIARRCKPIHAALLAQVCKVAKLFAKHFKVPEQQRLLESTVVGIASGTPNRLNRLADLDALKLDRLRLLLLDVHLDAKQRRALLWLSVLLHTFAVHYDVGA